MCGISGIYSFDGDPIRRDEITAQIETITHRGPDQGAVYLSNRRNCGLGIRRLSIIDVAGGQQPLANEDGSIHLVYNGETYNHPSLRCELEKLGHRPRTHSDGEALLHGYESWGPTGALQRLRGMAAFALWDEPQQQLFLGRDRFGIKPLYYAHIGRRLYFGSEIKAILAHPDVPRRVNLDALQAMLTLSFAPGPATMFDGIYKLPPAHYLIAKNGSFEIKRYWQLDYQPATQISELEAVEQFLTLLRESVELRLMSEVPLGALLSGGLDSGALVSLIISSQKPVVSSQRIADSGRWSAVSDQPSAVGGHLLKTVSIGFEHAAYDEAPLARALAAVLGTEHHAINFTADDFGIYPQVMHHLEEPQCSATAAPIYRLYQACRQAGLTVALTGEGSDELLGGYHWHKGDALMRRLLPLPAPLRRRLAASPLPMTAAARRVLTRGARDISTRYRDWLEVPGNGFRSNLFSGAINGALKSADHNPLLLGWAEKIANLKSVAPLHQTLWLETQTRMVDFINFEVDKMSMAHSIEARVPFLDHKLWEFCAGLPPRYKLRGQTEKYLLRQAAKNILPEETRRRRKKGLASPYARWLQQNRLPDWAEIALSAESLKKYGLFDPDTVAHLRLAHQAGRPGLGPLLMGVLSTQVWCDCFIS